jgi:hypothetical protein
VVYDHQLELPIEPYLEHCDVITFWTWKAENLAKMQDNFRRLCDMTLGSCYIYDYGNNQPMPMEAMKKQCAQYEAWLLDGTADGMVLCSNCCADVGFETVVWTRDWLKRIGVEVVLVNFTGKWSKIYAVFATKGLTFNN